MDVINCDQSGLLRAFLAYKAEAERAEAAREQAAHAEAVEAQVVASEAAAVVVAPLTVEELFEAALAAEARGDSEEAERLLLAACS